MQSQSTAGAQPAPANINHIQDTMLNVVYNFCSVITMPIEMALRPAYGSRYFPPVIGFLAAIGMIVLPALLSFTGAVTQMIPFATATQATGLIGMWGFSKLFFLGGLAHGFRIWRLMLHMEKEENSTYEGAPLFFFTWLPGASFWKIRIIFEPLFVFMLSLVLPNFFLIEDSAAHYLTFTSLCLAMKQYVAWFQHWEFLRNLMDLRNAGPRIAKIVEGQATEDDLATMHLASFPQDLPEDIRRSAGAHIARAFSAETPTAAASK